MEKWQTISEYEGLYEVSDYGNVRRVRPLKGVQKPLIVPGKNSKDYLHVTLSKNDKKKTYDIHRLVAKAFLGEPNDNTPHVNHKDGDKTNNRKKNLEWVSYKENMRHADKVLGVFPFRKSRHHMAKTNEASVEKAKRMRNDGIPVPKIAKFLGVSVSHTYCILRGYYW